VHRRIPLLRLDATAFCDGQIAAKTEILAPVYAIFILTEAGVAATT